MHVIRYLLFFGLVGLYQWGNAQCFPDQHSTNWFDGWISCETFPNPNTNREAGHWILYDFNQPYQLYSTKIWNTNDPATLANGVKDVVIDYSLDGNAWLEAGVYEWGQATGKSYYEGFDGPDLGGIQARYLLITALSNWGGPCYGLSEIQFEAEDNSVTSTEENNNFLDSKACFSAQLYPNPFATQSRIIIQTNCQDKIGYSIRDVLGRLVTQGSVNAGTGVHEIQVDGNQLTPGNYIVRIHQKGYVQQYPLMKM
jgi:hypothetical protein